MREWVEETFPNFLRNFHDEYPDNLIELWFQDETRFGQKTKISRVWSEIGSRRTAVNQNGFTCAYLFGAVNVFTGKHVGFLVPECNSEMMNIHLSLISKEIAVNSHVALVVDGAGWHQGSGLQIPNNISLLSLPPYSPELNPVERLWLWLKQNHLCNTTYKDMNAILDAGVHAWQALTDDIVKSVCSVTYATCGRPFSIW